MSRSEEVNRCALWGIHPASSLHNARELDDTKNGGSESAAT